MNLPQTFHAQMQQLLGDEECHALLEALNEEPSVSVRLNCRKAVDWQLPIESPVPWCEQGYYLTERPAFTFDPLFHAGTYYVQEASSMFLWHTMKILQTNVLKNSPLLALDLCAAPGGKTTLLADALPDDSLLVANEIVKQRAQVLRENVVKWGSPNVVVTNSDSSAFASMGEVFDLVVCDAPCSGEGMFRKDERAVEEWSPQNVELCWRRQREIVANVWACLKPGGVFIYSTCTFNIKENEQNVSWMMEELQAEPLDCHPDASWGIHAAIAPDLGGVSFPCYRFMPHCTRGEGLFMVALRKPNTDIWSSGMTGERPLGGGMDVKKETATKGKRKDVKVPADVSAWLADASDLFFDFDEKRQKYVAFPLKHIALLQRLRQYVHVIHAGIDVAEQKGNAHKGFKLQPCHSLAMCTRYSRGAFTECELDKAKALSYLRAESIVLPAGTPHGYVLLTYQHVPLGVANNLGTRANNLYPQEWRILSKS